MKASLKFREEQKPLFRAKVPLSILGMPFQSGIVAGESKELTLNIATFFESGPSLRFAYRPNDAWNPFSLVVKTGTGPYGSPFSSSFLMSAEFNLLGRGNNPSFMLHFKPRFGDFSIKKSHSSVLDKKLLRPQSGVETEEDSSIEVVESPAVNAGFLGESGIFAGKKFTVLTSEFPDASSISGLLSGMEMAARTSLPVKGRAVVNFRWGVRAPAGGESVAVKSGFSLEKIPFLVMNKIGIEQGDGEDSRGSTKVGPEPNADVVETSTTVKRQLEFLQAENGLLSKAVDDLRHEIVGGISTVLAGDQSSGKYREKSKWAEGDGNVESKKAVIA